MVPIFNIDVEKTGHVLTVNAQGLTKYHEVILAPECSGIRSFISLLALSCLFAYLQVRTLGQSIVLMLMTIPLVVVGNCIRVFRLSIKNDGGGGRNRTFRRIN